VPAFGRDFAAGAFGDANAGVASTVFVC